MSTAQMCQLRNVHIMRRHSRQGHLTVRLERIAAERSKPLKVRERPVPQRVANRLSDRDTDALTALYLRGASIKSLARSYNISEYSVREMLTASGAKHRTAAVSADEARQISRLRDAGRSLDFIAESLRVSVGTVRIVLAAAGAERGTESA